MLGHVLRRAAVVARDCAGPLLVDNAIGKAAVGIPSPVVSSSAPVERDCTEVNALDFMVDAIL